MERKKDYYVIDVAHIAKSVWSRIWIIALVSVLFAGILFSYATFIIKPTYSSSIMLYVNNSSISLGSSSFSISASEITAAQSLLKTYGEILNNRTTLERVIKKADVPYNYKQLSKKITVASSNETEIMKVTVTTHDPYEAAEIAECISEVLPMRISEIIDGATMEVVDSAIPMLDKVGPSISRYTIIGLLLGMVLSLVVLVLVAMSDNTIHDAEYLVDNYDCIILAKVSDLLDSDNSKYQQYYKESK